MRITATGLLAPLTHFRASIRKARMGGKTSRTGGGRQASRPGPTHGGPRLLRARAAGQGSSWLGQSAPVKGPTTRGPPPGPPPAHRPQPSPVQAGICTSVTPAMKWTFRRATLMKMKEGLASDKRRKFRSGKQSKYKKSIRKEATRCRFTVSHISAVFNVNDKNHEKK